MIKYATNLPYGIELVNDSILRKTSHCGSAEMLTTIRSLVNHFIKYPDPLVVPVYDWQENGAPDNGIYTYSYTMKRMALLSNEERHVVYLCCLLFDRPDDIYRNDFRKRASNSLVEYQKTYSELISFMQKAIVEKQYHDNHTGNFMKDELGDYHIIDIEGFVSYPSDIKKLRWINENI